MKKLSLAVLLLLIANSLSGQLFYAGVDLSYVNELEDCGIVYTENNVTKDPFQIFADHQCNLVRLRLWHSPSWYDNLHNGKRYSDLADVTRSIQRAKSAGMKVLLDFHLSDNWADPSKQVVPAAWASIVDNLSILEDSLYNYIYRSLSHLHQANLLPEMVQIGNETNKGILLSQAVNDAGWTLDWNRNNALFKTAIRSVRDIEVLANKPIEVAIHIANPADVDWFIGEFISGGVTDFDIIGISYYHQWHNTTSISQVGTTIAQLIRDYNKEVMLFEVGYPWTNLSNDNANNILSSAHPAYAPLSPAKQAAWLSDLSLHVKNNGGRGVIYWEPAWVSSNCSTQWAAGSHYENATFFDFQNNLQEDGGIKWVEQFSLPISGLKQNQDFTYLLLDRHHRLQIRKNERSSHKKLHIKLYDLEGKLLQDSAWKPGIGHLELVLPQITQGVYCLQILENGHPVKYYKIPIFQK